MCQPTLLPCLDTTVNCMAFKPEATNFYIYIRFVLPMRNALRHRIPELVCKYPTVVEKGRTHSIMPFTSHVKFHPLDSYCSDCLIPQCYICMSLT